MAGPKRDAKWLKEQLSRVLGWDDLILEGLVDAVVRAAGPGGDRFELDEMVQNFMADSPAGIALINEYMALSPATAAAAARSGGAGGSVSGGTAGRSYASSTAAPSSSAAAAATASQRPATVASGGQRQQQQQQQQKQAVRAQHSHLSSAGASAASTSAAAAAAVGWQALGPGTATNPVKPPNSSAAAAATVVPAAVGRDDEDDFSRFVVDDRTDGGSGGKGGSRSKPGSSRDLQALDATAAGAEKPSSAGDGGCKVLGMFKAGGRIKAPAAKPVGVRGPEGGALALAASLERKVINCLGCGKIYDCRNVTNDILRFLDRGGVCTFCGDVVPLSYKDRQKAAEAAAAEAAAAAAGAEDAATAAARAFKDRLVEYDRNAAKRTTVIDDQSDFFEIDTNAWLTDQEREELRRRRQLEEQAEAARRKRLTVTIDLIGRKVVLDEDVRKAEEAAAAAAAERAAAAAAAAEALRNTDGDGGGASAYGGGVAFSGNALGGAAGGGPTREQLEAALESLRRMKASINPAVSESAAPLFLPAKPPGAAASSAAGTGTGSAIGAAGTAAALAGGGGPAGASRRTAPSGTAAAAAAAAAGAGSSQSGGGAKGRGAAAGRSRPTGPSPHAHTHPPPPRRHERVQHDLGAEFGFDAFGAEVVLDDLMGGALLAVAEEEQDGPYDVCMQNRAPSTSYTAVAKAATPAPRSASRPLAGLPPGVVLLKGFLTMDEQIRVVLRIRELGIGPGGFYIPSYSSGARLNLRMMCLGLHWEPRTSEYEPTRSSYDGATPPQIPRWLLELCGRCLAAASAASVAGGGSCFPPLSPDICLANFYERSGRLGMHQDKDEMPDSLRAGLPVVSLSLGDAADFLYGRTRDEEHAGRVRLDSGDVLVFGGPGRMIYHSVARIHPNTAPQELVHATGLRPGRLNLTFRQYRAA